ncbi:EAL domain-containing protein [Fulvimarina sp. MAC8]|uniref:putative bifunctional diguanylate cyclase/phosphodiesterase n=1 Tax=Fulvimarina sp. MAC8 TaxID=3162874 RepID=UPI0032EC28E8
MKIFQNAASREILILSVFGLVIWGLAHNYDAFDFLAQFLEKHERWELDEIIFAILSAGLMGFVYAWRRLRELRKETRQRNAAELEAAWFAYHDPLTQLPNRHFIDARLADGNWGIAEVGSVIAVDLDGFKKVNDLVGHHGGDELLVVVSQRLRSACPTEVIIRLGGDEFLLLTSAIGEDANGLCDQIIEILAAPIVICGIQVDVGASIGFAPYCKVRGFEEAMQQADMAMYAAKRRGRNTVCAFEPSLQDAQVERVEIERALRHAIDEHQIRLHYQPLIDLGTQQVRGFEALARWTLEDRTSIPPSKFITIAEEAGLITRLSEQLLRQACLDALTWPSDFYVAFNLSPMQLADHLLGLRIIRILSETGLPPHRLEVEITESALIQNLQTARTIIDELRTAGMTVAIDDFGTGFSSLSQLANIPFDRIKIDRSFIGSFEANAKQAKIMRSIVELGQGLNVQTTAEGIELKSQYEHLSQIGCVHGQGYLFSKPLPADRVPAFLKEAGQHNGSARQRQIAG